MTRKDWLRNIANVYCILAVANGFYYFSENWRMALGATSGFLLVEWLRASWHATHAKDNE